MAGPSAFRNLPLPCGKDELARETLTESSGTPTPTFAISRALTPTLAQVFALILGPPSRYTDKDLQKAIKLPLGLFVQGQEYGQLQINSVPSNRPLKCRNPDL